MNVLEEFWYGNLDPAEYDANPSKEYKELVRLISRNEEKLLATILSAFLWLFWPEALSPVLQSSGWDRSFG